MIFLKSLHLLASRISHPRRLQEPLNQRPAQTDNKRRRKRSMLCSPKRRMSMILTKTSASPMTRLSATLTKRTWSTTTKSLSRKSSMKKSPETLSKYTNSLKNIFLNPKSIKRRLSPKSRLHTSDKGSQGTR